MRGKVLTHVYWNIENHVEIVCFFIYQEMNEK